MDSIRGFLGRHLGILLALLASAFLVPSRPSRLDRPRVVLPAHEAHIVEFSPDGRLLVTDGDSGGRLRDATTGRVLVRLTRADGSPATQFTWPRFTADGRHLVAQIGGPRFGDDRCVTVAVFDLDTGRERASFARIPSDVSPGLSYALSADGSTLAFCRIDGFGPERKGTITVRDIDAEKSLAEFPGLPPMALAPDGRAIAHGENGARARASFPIIRPVRPARTQSHRIVRTDGLGPGPVAFSADGQLIAARISGDRGEVVEVRDTETGRVRSVLRPVASLPNGFAGVERIRFGPDGHSLFLLESDDPLRPQVAQCWDICGAWPFLGLQGPLQNIAACGSRGVLVKPALRNRHNGEPTTAEVLDLPEGRAGLRIVDVIGRASISPDGRILALEANRFVDDPFDQIEFLRWILRAFGLWHQGPPMVQEISLRNAGTGACLGTIARSIHGFPGPLTFSPDGRTLIVTEIPFDSAQFRSDNRPIDWHVEWWSVPATGAPAGTIPTGLAMVSAAMVLVAAWLDRRRARRATMVAA